MSEPYSPPVLAWIWAYTKRRRLARAERATQGKQEASSEGNQ